MHGCEGGCKSVRTKRHFSKSSEARGTDSYVCIPKLNEPKKTARKKWKTTGKAKCNSSPKKRSLSNTQPETRVDQSDTSHTVACETCHSIESIRTVPGSSKYAGTA